MSIADRAPSWIEFVTADDWGRVLQHSMSPERLNDPETFIHHSAGSAMSRKTGRAAMRDLQSFSHSRGYATVAYDAVQHQASNGKITILEGRGAARSAATRDRNEEGEAYCLLGYFHPGHSLSAVPTDREVEAAAWGVAWMIEKGWSAPDTRLLGHRDNPRHPGATACPGDFLYVRIPTIAQRVREILAPPPPVAHPDPSEEEVMFTAFVKHQSAPAVYKQMSNGTKTWVRNPQQFAIEKALAKTDKVHVFDDNWTRAAGVIVGPRPTGVDGWGVPL